uniref:CIS tube protein n=1 Tax=Candidatus Electronema sp. TaxID=2698783 RepID=UPI0040572DD0
MSEKMVITSCSIDNNGNIEIDESNKVEVQINPTSFSHEHSIAYSKNRIIGSIGEDLKYKRTNIEKISFEIVLDGTGVASEKKEAISVKEQIKIFKNIIYDYAGQKHQPKPVNLIWGSFSFNGRLVSLSIDYTMFASDGSPLRAKLKISVNGYTSKEEQAKKSNKSSPDLTHIIEVKAGDTLPLLCYQVYRDTSYYPDVARINGLNSLQEMRPGLKLTFPPLR